jgi:asparagine synthase (glutamine-hydrolysing)
MVWDERVASRSQRAFHLCSLFESQRVSWRRVVVMRGFRIYQNGSCHTSTSAHVLVDQGGVIIGQLFNRSGGDAIRSVGEARPADRQRSLMDHTWGRYVAFLRCPTNRSTEVIRDPSGAMRCFFTVTGGVHLFCSHLEDLAGLGLSFSVNWNYVVAELANQAAMGWDQTGLNEVTSLRAGECLQISGCDARRIALWDIARFARAGIADEALDVREVRDTVRHCVESWTCGHERIAVLLSGGLDSSIIVSCLRDFPGRPAVSCLNYFHGGNYRADERAYARLAAEHAGCDLSELERSTEVHLEKLLDLPKSARPSHNNLDHLLSHERTTAWAKARGATAIITGDLGDQLFCQQLAGHAPIDCLWARGFGRELIRVASDLARIEARSIFGPLISACVYGYACRSGRRWVRRHAARAERRYDTNPYLRARVAGSYDYRLQERWIEAMYDLPLGKLLHIASIAGAQAYLTPIGGTDDPEWVAPLNSQPIVELCARIPVWKFVRNGRDRSVLREAFAKDVPTQIIQRRSKGTTSTQRSAVYARNTKFLREALMEGVLASHGLLDVNRIERDLSKQDYRHNVWLERCIRTETWLRAWESSSLRG